MRSSALLCILFQFVFYSCSLDNNENLSFFYKCIDEYRQDLHYDHYNKSDEDSLFYLIAFFKKGDKYEILLNANNVEIPKMIERPSPNKKMEPINKNFIGYKEYKNNFLFIYDYSDGEIPVLLSPLTENLEKDIKANRLLSKYDTEEWTLDSKCWRLYFDNNLKLKCKK